MKNIIKKTFIPILFLLGFTPLVSMAASVSILVPESANVGDAFSIDILADTDEELINSINMILDFQNDLVSFAGYKAEGTLVKLWVDPPHEKDGKIYFSGIIPGGVSGLYDASKQELGDIPLVRLLFVAKGQGMANFSFIQTELLKHDGLGTPLFHEQISNSVPIQNLIILDKDNGKTDNIFDKNPPKPFEITFVSSSVFSKTPSMIIFNAYDTESGIKYYKMKKGGGSWQDTKSPQSINRSIFPQNITIRAYDYYDNFTDSNIIIAGSMPLRILFISLAILILGILGYKLVKYKL